VWAESGYLKILIDSREKQPLTFSNRYITNVITTKLNVGDYGCQFEDGHVPDIFFERKSIGDLYGTLGKGYVRFKKEVKRAQEIPATLIICVEGDYTSVLTGYDYSERKGASIIAQVHTLLVKHGVWTVFFKNREEMSEYITNFYIACGKEYVRKESLCLDAKSSTTQASIQLNQQ
jgi:ERCC4-type nuclease